MWEYDLIWSVGLFSIVVSLCFSFFIQVFKYLVISNHMLFCGLKLYALDTLDDLLCCWHSTRNFLVICFAISLFYVMNSMTIRLHRFSSVMSTSTVCYGPSFEYMLLPYYWIVVWKPSLSISWLCIGVEVFIFHLLPLSTTVYFRILDPNFNRASGVRKVCATPKVCSASTYLIIAGWIFYSKTSPILWGKNL